MITSMFNENESYEDFVLMISKFKIDELVTHQLNVFNKTFDSRTNETIRGIESVRSTPVSLDGFTLSYPLTIKYLDMRKSRTGKTKIVHFPIYLKLIYGHMFGGRKNKIAKDMLSLNTLIRLKYKHTLTSILNTVKYE